MLSSSLLSPPHVPSFCRDCDDSPPVGDDDDFIIDDDDILPAALSSSPILSRAATSAAGGDDVDDYIFDNDCVRSLSTSAASSAWRESFWFKSVAIPLVLFLPLWWRFIQCLVRYKETAQRWPHLGNAMK